MIGVGNSLWNRFLCGTVPGDTTPPTVTSTSPAAGATNVAVATAVTAVFSEAMDAATVNSSTFELRDGANNLAAGTVAFAAATRTATLTPSAALTPSTSYTATVKGGAAGVADLAGNPLAADLVWSFTTAEPASGVCETPCSIWGDADTPATASVSDSAAVELGVKFRSAIDGFITGIRFYKGDLNTGTHVGNLWTATGTRLATATFTNETATGWQQVNFSAPVPITANTTYVASYHAPNGGYAFNESFFTTAIDKPPLRLLSDTEAGGNGVFRYGASQFPNQSFGAANYWVDVLFSDTSLD